MHHKIQTPILIATLILLALAAQLGAQVSLADQLNAQYNLVKMGEDSNGAAVIEAGTILKISLLGHFGKQQTTQFFQVGNKVYPTKIQVNMDKDQVVMGIVSCDSCNNISPTTFYKADVVFQFTKGELAKMSAPQVEDAIAGLLAIDDSGGAQNQPAPEPAQIEKGQTPDQVKAAIGVPDKIINLGTKQIYVYKDIKVTFVNGKVSDVQ